ncbi:hypothetical protein DEA98_16010 [Brucella pseudogrignonensis]|nr:hypothetical protein [Brucella pseudogrignonensis]
MLLPNLGGSGENFFSIGIVIWLSVSVATAADGSSLKCNVSKFTSTSNQDDVESHFINANMQKVFDIFESKNNFTVIGQSRDIKPYKREYEILHRGTHGSYAVGDSTTSFETLVVQQDNRFDGKPITAAVTVQSSSSVNTWLLTCIKLK